MHIKGRKKEKHNKVREHTPSVLLEEFLNVPIILFLKRKTSMQFL